MFREMRRKDRLLSTEKAYELLQNCTYGTLSTVGEDGFPYGVPVNYVLLDGVIYIHCAGEGHKLDNIRACPKVCFSAVGTANVLPADFSTAYDSVIAFGRACEVTGEERIRALTGFITKYAPGYMQAGEAYIRRAANETTVIRIDVEHITAKGRKAP